MATSEKGKYQLFAKNHNHQHPAISPRQAVTVATSHKTLSDIGGINKIDWIEKEDGTREIFRHKKSKDKISGLSYRQCIQIGVENSLKDRPDLFLLPIARTPTAPIAVTASSPCENVCGQINPFIQGAMEPIF